MNFWLIKTEPGTYSWDDLVKDNKTHWDGVRNYQARNNMKAMQAGDLALYYHSVDQKTIVGIAKIVTEYYQDPTTEDEAWVVVDVAPERKLKRNIHLSEVKQHPQLTEMVLVKNSRLSVQPVTKEEFEIIVSLSENG